MTIWFDCEDLFAFVGSGNRRTSGIQRMCLELYRALHGMTGGDCRVRFVRHGDRTKSFEIVRWEDLAAHFAPQHQAPLNRSGVAPTERSSRAAAVGSRLLQSVPASMRGSVGRASAAQAQVAAELGQFGANLVLLPAAAAGRTSRAMVARIRRKSSGAAAPGFEEQGKPGDTLLVLGALWTSPGYDVVARWLRDERRMRFGVLVHDLRPVRRPEWSPHGQARGFADWYRNVLPLCDLVLANSRHTAGDVEAFARESGIALPGPVQVLPVGTGFGLPAAAASVAPSRREYVLFVSTLAPHKNHVLAVRIWRMLLDEVKAGRRRPESVPDLVFAGYIGWTVEDLIEQLDNTDWLGGRIRLIKDPTDSELRALYSGCLFTFFPSLSEGWGLPVTESLALGKPCLSSNAGALPEAGGKLCRYFDPEDLSSAYHAVAELLDDRSGLAAWEERVRREFRPIAWTEPAQALLDAVATLK